VEDHRRRDQGEKSIRSHQRDRRVLSGKVEKLPTRQAGLGVRTNAATGEDQKCWHDHRRNALREADEPYWTRHILDPTTQDLQGAPDAQGRRQGARGAWLHRPVYRNHNGSASSDATGGKRESIPSPQGRLSAPAMMAAQTPPIWSTARCGGAFDLPAGPAPRLRFASATPQGP